MLDGESTDDNPQLVQILREKFLVPPSKEPYNLNEPMNANPSMGQAQAVDIVLKGKVILIDVG